MRVGALLGESLRDQLGVRQDDGEQVVEVVGNPAGELADRFHLLGLAQLLLEGAPVPEDGSDRPARSEEHTSELQSRQYLVCRLLLEKKKKNKKNRLTVSQ